MIRLASVLLIALLLLPTCPTFAHEVRPAYLELRETSPGTYDALWKVPARGDLRLALRLVWPEGVRHAKPPSAILDGGAYLERSRIVQEGGLEGESIRVAGLESTITDVLVRVERRDGSTQVTRLTPDRPFFTVESSPGRLEVARTYLVLGAEHIWLGIDHLLFVLSLLLLVRGWGRLVKTVTAFTVAHSITLTAATLGLVQIPGSPVEAVIALSIVLVAVEIVREKRGQPGTASRWPWMVSFAFGLLHGFGFAGALHEIGLPQTAISIALGFFNVGVELGQLVFITAVLLLSRGVGHVAERVAKTTWRPGWKIAGAYGIGSIAAFWFVERTLALL
ncbi:MAG TPA: HupE/UreJ family protein [Candidatus Eisenbacteria bacterium]|nr:HupE/UreJ family protein [Candidatus Eisenbacteria bacterium]